jgi:hypothetical protein
MKFCKLLNKTGKRAMAKKIPIDEEALKRQMLSGKSVLVPAVSTLQEAPIGQNLSKGVVNAVVSTSQELPIGQVLSGGAAGKDVAVTPVVAAEVVAAEVVAAYGQEQEDGEDDDVLSKVMAAPAKKQPSADGDKDLSRYERLFLSRSIVGLPRTNVGISLLTLEKVEKVIYRVFDGRIAVSTFIDNIVTEHIARHEKSMNRWLLEKSVNLFD